MEEVGVQRQYAPTSICFGCGPANENGLRMGGPLYADDHKTMIGSMVVKEFVDRSSAEEFIANEPYNKAGLFGTVLINPFGAFVDK